MKEVNMDEQERTMKKLIFLAEHNRTRSQGTRRGEGVRLPPRQERMELLKGLERRSCLWHCSCFQGL